MGWENLILNIVKLAYEHWIITLLFITFIKTPIKLNLKI